MDWRMNKRTNESPHVIYRTSSPAAAQKRRKSKMGTYRPTDRWTKRGVESRSTRLKIGSQIFFKNTNTHCLYMWSRLCLSSCFSLFQSVFLSVSVLCVSVCFSLSVFPSVSVCFPSVSVCLSVCFGLSIILSYSICLSATLYLSASLSVSVCQSACHCLLVSLSVCLSVCLSFFYGLERLTTGLSKS